MSHTHEYPYIQVRNICNNLLELAQKTTFWRFREHLPIAAEMKHSVLTSLRPSDYEFYNSDEEIQIKKRAGDRRKTEDIIKDLEGSFQDYILPQGYTQGYHTVAINVDKSTSTLTYKIKDKNHHTVAEVSNHPLAGVSAVCEALLDNFMQRKKCRIRMGKKLSRIAAILIFI